MPSCSNPLFLSVKIEIIHHGYGYGEVEEEDEWEAVTETGMKGFMMPYLHAEKGAETATKEGNGKETGFRDTPFVMTGFPLVNAIEKEGNQVDCYEVEQEGI